MRKTLLSLLLLPLLAYGLVKGYLWYQVREEMNRVVGLAAPFATIDYQQIFSSVDGRAGVGEISITPHQSASSVRIAAIELRAPDLWFLVRGQRDLARGQMPERLGLAVRGLSIPLEGDLLAPVQGLVQSAAAPINAANGPCSVEGPEGLRALGYNTLRLDVDLGYELVPAQQSFILHAGLYAEDMFSTEIRASFVAEGPSFNVASAMAAAPPLTGLTLTYQDDSYLKRKALYCADRLHQSVADYAADEVQRLSTTANLAGYRLSQGILDAYRAVLEQPGEISLAVHPSQPLTAAAYGPETLLKQLNLELRVNDQPVQDLEIAFIDRPREQPEANASAGASGQNAPTKRVLVQKYLEVEHAELAQHIGRKVRVLTSRGKEYEGKLLRIKPDGDLDVQMLTGGGSLTFEVPTSDIAQLHVLLYVESLMPAAERP